MKIEIVEDKKQSLFAYKDEELLFYSTIKFNWLRRNLIKIFDCNDNLVLELKRTEPVFSSNKFKILFHNEVKLQGLVELNETFISFEKNKILKRKSNNFLTNINFSYFYNDNKIADIKEILWTSLQKQYLEIENENVHFLDQIIIHILSIKTGYNSNSI